MSTDFGVRAKIAAAAAVATVCLLSLVGAFGYRGLVSATRQSQFDLLNQRIDAVEQQIQTDGGRTVARSSLDASIRIVPTGAELPPIVPQTLQVIRMQDSDEIRAIVGIADTSRIDATLSTIRTALWISVPVIGMLVAATSWIVVGRSLSPVRRLTGQAEANMTSRTMEPVSEEGGHGEILQLASTFNAMLGRLRNADVDRRRFVSDASHELRTPLMVLRADAEFALEHDVESVELATTVMAQTDRLSSLVDDLLTLATLDEEEATPVEHVTVSALVTDAAAETALRSELDPGLAATLVPDVSRALANIVDNARRHAEDQVLVDIERHADELRVFVDDDGPGVEVDERERVFTRFYRPDHDRNRGRGGAGLGLAIAMSSIVRAGGSIQVDESPLGGARFVLTVPID